VKEEKFMTKAGKRSIWKKTVVFLFCISNSIVFFAQPLEKINILTSIFPLYEFSHAVCGERGKVDILIPPGAEVHTWRPKPSDIIKISQADLFIVVGSVLEPWLEDILKSVKNPKLHILETSAGFKWEEEQILENHSHDHESGDPHIWLDFDYDMQIVEQISSILTEIDPSNADLYRRNARNINLRLKNLDNLYKEELGRCSLRTFVLGGHSAFGYIAQKYELNQVSVYGLNPDSLPSPRKLVETVRIAKEQGVRAIYFEATLNDDIARMIANEVGCQTLALNPGANVSKKELQSGVSFFDIMKKNLENLKIGLNCK
jgi:zinc transport system substrate-binding protein